MTSFSDIPIPPLDSTEGWRDVEILDNHEELVAVSPECPSRVVVEPAYHKAGFSAALSECYVREGVARRLCEAGESLPAGWKLVVFDGWRPLGLQAELFSMHKKQLQGNRPAASPEEIQEEAQKFVSSPSSNLECPSPHSTGGAVDLSLRNERGADLEMGTEFDSFDERAGTRYFEEKLERDGGLPPDESTFLKNRRVLFHTLVAVGFTNYPAEWWHFDFGNQFWARIKGRDAAYGITSPEGIEGASGPR